MYLDELIKLRISFFFFIFRTGRKCEGWHFHSIPSTTHTLQAFLPEATEAGRWGWSHGSDWQVSWDRGRTELSPNCFKQSLNLSSLKWLNRYCCMYQRLVPLFLSTSSPSPLALLHSQVPGIVKALHKQLKDKSVKTRQGCFSLLTALVTVLPGALDDHIGAIVPGILYSLK